MTDEQRGREIGSTPSFEGWAAARAPSLMRFAYLVTGSQHAAEDAVQSALSQAWEKWTRVVRTDHPDAYVRRMIVNAHVSAWRRAGRRELTVPEVYDRGAEPASTDLAESVVRDDAVWRTCRALPPQQRAAVVLRFYEDLDYPEIAQVLGIAEVTARSHVHRGLAVLRTELSDQEDH